MSTHTKSEPRPWDFFLNGEVTIAAIIAACLLFPVAEATAEMVSFSSPHDRLIATGVGGNAPSPHSSKPAGEFTIAQNTGLAIVKPEEPFRKRTVVSAEGNIWQKWKPVTHAIRDELEPLTAKHRTMSVRRSSKISPV